MKTYEKWVLNIINDTNSGLDGKKLREIHYWHTEAIKHEINVHLIVLLSTGLVWMFALLLMFVLDFSLIFIGICTLISGLLCAYVWYLYKLSKLLISMKKIENKINKKQCHKE